MARTAPLYGGCTTLTGETGMARPFYLEAVAQHDPDFLPLVESEREFVMKDGAIPGKYKALMTMI